MPRDEVTPEDKIGFSKVGRKINSVTLAESDFIEHFTERAFVQWLAVHDHAVHVENDRLKWFH